jgi:hypothetical protein
MNKPRARVCMIFRLALMVGLAGLLSSCATPLVMIPDDIGDRGLLVAQVAAPNMPDVMRAVPDINNKEYQFGMRDGFIVIALEPGEYTLGYLSVLLGTGSTTTPIGGTSYTRSMRNYPIKKRFKIEAGRFTNLGLLVLEPGGKTGEAAKKFNLLLLDNSDDMVTFLKESHPRLFASMKNRTPLLGEGPYLNKEQIQQLRQAVATDAARKKQASNEPLHYVAGAAGNPCAHRKGRERSRPGEGLRYRHARRLQLLQLHRRGRGLPQIELRVCLRQERFFELAPGACEHRGEQRSRLRRERADAD